MSRTLLSAAAATLLLASCVAEDQVGELRANLEDPSCGHYADAIIDVNGDPIGYVVVTNTDQDLVIDVTAGAGVVLKSLSLYAGQGPVPANSVGKVYPEFFPHQVVFPEPYASAYTFSLPLADLGVEPGTCGEVVVSLYATAALLASNGSVLKKYTGWAYGDIVFPHGSYATGYGFHYQICCEPPPPVETGCTLTQGYWKTHNEFADKKLAVDWPAPHDELDQLCGLGWLDILKTPPAGGNAWLIVAHQYIAAMLNVASGASTTEQVDQALADAEAFLDATCASAPSSENPEAINTGAILDAYNNGDIGPGHCD